MLNTSYAQKQGRSKSGQAEKLHLLVRAQSHVSQCKLLVTNRGRSEQFGHASPLLLNLQLEQFMDYGGFEEAMESLNSLIYDYTELGDSGIHPCYQIAEAKLRPLV